MKTNELKTKVLHYWRFTRSYKYVATEAGKFNSDILVSNEKEIIECEIKNSKSDLVNDLKKKKHGIYKNPSKWYSQWIPNKFYFAIPKNLLETATELTEGTPYGVILIEDKILTLKKKEKYCTVIKQARILQNNFKIKLQDQIILRMSSELIRIRLKYLI